MTACTASTCQSEFTTFFGTGIQGIWVTWKNSAADVDGTITAATELAFKADIRLYGVGL